ncbi:putative alpha/beta hydrolase [Nonlabens dokdonensis DSW-6]|nr:putative alpha/beta hydrolase [Nonlabens dokdonensis DSW-6]
MRVFTTCFVVFVMTLFSSCTVLQYRKTDKEMLQTFQKNDVQTSFVYHQVDSLNFKVRAQKVSKDGNTYNIIFIHGAPSSLVAWQAFLLDEELASRANLYAVDRPGYGYTSFGKALPSIEQQAIVINGLLEELNLKNMVVVGSSYGGPIAARIAVINKNVDGVIMISAAIDPSIEKDIWASRFTRWKLTRWIVPTGYRVAGDEKKVHAAELQKIEKDWPQVTVPIAHFHGDADDIVPVENLVYTDSAFAKARTKTFPDVGHELAWKNPEIMKDEILSFLKELSKSKE